MTEKSMACNSCHKKITNTRGSVIFMCPGCNKYEIVRCEHCRKVAAKYHCHECNFIGPN